MGSCSARTILSSVWAVALLACSGEHDAPPDAAIEPGYVISWVNGDVVAHNRLTGADDFRGPDLDAVLQLALDGLTAERQTAERVAIMGAFAARGPFRIGSHTLLDLSAAQIDRVDAANGIMFQNSDLVGGNTDIRIEGGTLDGNWDGQTVNPPYPGPGPTSQYTVLFSAVTDSQIVGTTFLDDRDATLHCEACERVSVVGVTLRGSRYESVSFWGGSFNEVLDSSFFDGLGSGIATAGSSDVLIRGNLVDTVGDEQRTYSSISVNGRRNHAVGNTIRNGFGSGFTIGHLAEGDPYNVSDSVFEDNDISNMRGPGFSLLNGTPTKNVMIRNNKVDGTREGVAIGPGTATDPVEGLIVEDNTISRSQSYCIRVSGGHGLALRNITLRRNHCVNNGQGGSSDIKQRSAIAVFGEPTVLVPGVVVTENQCYDDQAVKTQWYGLYMKDTSGLSVTNNALSANEKGSIYSAGTNENPMIDGNH
ncbi:MAG: right-handed parallel beta-helix repeat-containing protein [Kofleriaceae bacterium]